MVPTTTSEEAIEHALVNKLEALKNTRLKMSSLRKELINTESILLKNKIDVTELQEELKKFRMMFPSFCKQTTDLMI